MTLNKVEKRVWNSFFDGVLVGLFIAGVVVAVFGLTGQI